MGKRRVAVTGLGCVSPVGLDAQQTWEALVRGDSGISSISRFDASELPSRIAGEASGFDGSQRLSLKDLRKMDRFVQLGVVAGLESLEASGVDIERVNPDRVGVVVGRSVRSAGYGACPWIKWCWMAWLRALNKFRLRHGPT